MLKELALCAKLMPYGKNYKLCKACGIIMIIMSLLIYIPALAEDDITNTGILQVYFYCMGFVIMESPALQIAQRGTLAASKLRRAADIYFGPGFMFAGMFVVNIVWTILGCIGAALRPAAADIAVYTLCVGVLMYVVISGAFIAMKGGIVMYMGIIVLACAAMAHIRLGIENLTAVFTGIYSPVGAVAVCGLACTGALVVVFLLDCLFGKLLYRKNYAKLFTRWANSEQ